MNADKHLQESDPSHLKPGNSRGQFISLSHSIGCKGNLDN